ncbi:carbohydrate-binding protein [Paenibacillus antri]|uniref:Carbohydrate-binding protein n=1 Tax=Paenibacillus antri TaxID=2582848 RepID=A0A5R9FXC4_9BACL|nr:family 43 glycosylhydrolase [Paenibacillus antri]TLS48647.1 carbohydrate-binding protein [Paenibacillus antri]
MAMKRRTMAIVYSILIAALAVASASPALAANATPTYSNPLKPERGADPWVYKHTDGYYYYMTTAGGVSIWKSKTLSGLTSGEKTEVWTLPSAGPNSREMWAPELHYLEGKWYIYYTATDRRPNGTGDPLKRRTFVLENDSPDPTKGTWIDRGQVFDPDNDYWAIDGTVLEHNGELYFAWSGKPYDYAGGEQRIYIATLSDPVTMSSNRVELSRPTYDWETGGTPINEAPQFLKRDGNIFLVFSASHCSSDEYKLGFLSAPEDADLLNPEAWTKHPTPLFQQSPENGAYGTGHNSFTTSPDGTENYMVYHANPESGQGCGQFRQTRLQKVEWNPDGTPNAGVPTADSVDLPLPSGEPVKWFLEAEAAAVSNGAEVSKTALHYTGTGYAVANGAGETIEWTVELDKHRNYILDFRYSNLASTTEQLELRVDGELVLGGLALPQTATRLWADYKLASREVRLKKGVHTISVTATSGTPIYIDSLTIYQIPPSELGDDH